MTVQEEEQEEQEEEDDNDKNKQNKNNKKKKVGLAAASQEDLKRIVAMGQKARLVALKRMKEESGGLPLKMGLATVDKATRQKIAALGGKTMRETYDLSYYSEIGKKGGNAVLERYSVTYFSDLGRKPKKNRKKKQQKLLNDPNETVRNAAQELYDRYLHATEYARSRDQY
jgi:general stress protein YciG